MYTSMNFITHCYSINLTSPPLPSFWMDKQTSKQAGQAFRDSMEYKRMGGGLGSVSMRSGKRVYRKREREREGTRRSLVGVVGSCSEWMELVGAPPPSMVMGDCKSFRHFSCYVGAFRFSKGPVSVHRRDYGLGHIKIEKTREDEAGCMGSVAAIFAPHR